MSQTLLPSLEDGEVFRQCFEGSLEGVVLTDLKGRIVFANQVWLDLHGYALAEVVGQTTRLVRSATSDRAMYEHMWRQISDPAIGRWRGEIVNRCKDGRELALRLSISPVRDGDSIVGYLGLSIDLTEQKRLEELKRLYDLVVVHDLRSPLSAISGILDALVGGLAGPLSETARDLVERAQRQSKRMRGILATTLDLEKLKQRKLELDSEEVDLFAILRGSVETLAEAAGAKSVQVELRAADRLATSEDRQVLELDALHLQRCTDNLVKNAIEASPRGGRVWAQVEADASAVRVRVHNGGAPIPPDVRATLFHPFGTYGKRGGTGLGLYGVKLLVEAMGGQVRFESDESGTVFTLEFPRGSPKAS